MGMPDRGPFLMGGFREFKDCFPEEVMLKVDNKDHELEW